MPDLRWDHTSGESYSYTDFNRIETIIQQLQELLSGYGYTVSNPCKTDWTRDNPPSYGEINRIRNNINALQEVFCQLPDWQEIIYNNTIDFGQVNVWEWDLHTVSVWLDRMAAAWCFCGDLYVGEV